MNGSSTRRRHILIVGGGYVGMYTAYRLERKLRPHEATITVVDPNPCMTYQPFLAEAAAGSIDARHVVIPLRTVLKRARVVTAEVTSIDHDRRAAKLIPVEGQATEMRYDILVMAVGSVARTAPVPGLAEQAVGFHTVGEAIHLRNHVLSRLDVAASTDDLERRRRALTFLFVGGGYAGVEACAELEDMTRYAMRYYPELSPADMHWVLVDRAARILPEVSLTMSAYAARQLAERNLDLRLHTFVESVAGGVAVLSDGTHFETDAVVWTAGVAPHPLLVRTDLPLDGNGRLACHSDLRVIGADNAYSAGDCASVPDLSSSAEAGACCAPTAQHAVRQARTLARNITASLRSGELKAYRHADAGSVGSLGLHKGVAEVYGVRMRGILAWFLHRTYHVSRVPTFNRKVRIVADWTLALVFRREVVSLGRPQQPGRQWELLAGQLRMVPHDAPAGARAPAHERPR